MESCNKYDARRETRPILLLILHSLAQFRVLCKGDITGEDGGLGWQGVSWSHGQGDPVVWDTIQLQKGHGFDHRKSHWVSINNHVSRQMVLEIDPECLPAHSVQVQEWSWWYTVYINQTWVVSRFQCVSHSIYHILATTIASRSFPGSKNMTSNLERFFLSLKLGTINHTTYAKKYKIKEYWIIIILVMNPTYISKLVEEKQWFRKM